MKKALRWSLALGLSGAGLWFALRGADPASVGEAVRGMRAPFWLLLLPAATFVEFCLRSWRWEMILAPLGSAVPARGLFSVVAGAFFLNNVLPFRAGEIARVYWTAQATGVPWSSCLSALAVDRVFDLMSLLTVVTFVLLRKADLFPSAGPVAAFAAVTLGCLAAFAAMARYPEPFARAAGQAWVPNRLKGFVLQFIEGSRALRRAGTFLAAYAVSLVFWLMNIGVILGTARLFGLPLGPTDAAWVQVGLCAGVLLPSAPGYVGTFEAAGVASLGILGYDRNAALPVLLALHAVSILSTVLFGLPGVWKGSLKTAQAPS